MNNDETKARVAGQNEALRTLDAEVARLASTQSLTSLRTLVANLAIGAALCRSFALGVHINGAGWWHPGRGDEAPEFEGLTVLDENAP